MSYIEESLSSVEVVKDFFSLHWYSATPIVFWVILALPTFGLTLILAIWEYLSRRSIEQGVTNKRVIFKKGIISRKTEEMKLSSIETVEINQGIFGRMLGFGTVKVTGRGISDVVYKNIDDPMKVKKIIESIEAT